MGLVLRCDNCSRELRREDWSEIDEWVHACRPSPAVVRTVTAGMAESEFAEVDHDRHFDSSFCSLDCAIAMMIGRSALDAVEA